MILFMGIVLGYAFILILIEYEEIDGNTFCPEGYFYKNSWCYKEDFECPYNQEKIGRECFCKEFYQE